MARPPKSGIEYFPLDVDMDNDEKVAYVIARHGFMAFGLLIKLYMEIYRRGYYLAWDERQRFLLAHQLNIDAEYTETVVSACIDGGIFDRNLFFEYGVLTSHGIQSRYLQATGRRSVVKMATEVCLLNLEEIKKAKIEFTSAKLTKTPISDDKNGVSVDINHNSCESTEKEFSQQDYNKNPVFVNINHSFSKISGKMEGEKIISSEKKTISDDKNPVSVDITSAEMPQSKVNNITTTTEREKVDEDFAEVARLFEDNIHPICGEIDRDKLADLFHDFGKKWVAEGIKEAALSNVRNIKYITAILDRWKRDGFKAPKQSKGKESVKRGGNGRTTRTAKSKGNYEDFDAADRNQVHPWDLPADPGGDGAQSGEDNPL